MLGKKEETMENYGGMMGDNSEEQKENVLLGLLGAVIGSVVGAALIILLGWLGYMASIAGVLMAFGTITGYKTLGKKLSIKGVIISVLVMVVMTYLAERMVWSMGIFDELVKEYDDVSLMAIFQNLHAILAEFDMFAGFAKDLMMVYIFTAIGAVPTIKKHFKAEKQAAVASDNNQNVA